MSRIPCASIEANQSAEVLFSLGEYEASRSWGVFLNGILLREFGAVRHAFDFLERRVPEAVALLSENFVFVHAGTVRWQDRAILIPGASWTGKSCLTMALVEAGAVYYSDEYAVIDRQGRVYPYRREPKLRSAVQGETPRLSRRDLHFPADLLSPILPGLVLFTEYESGSNWIPSLISPGESLFGLLTNTVAIRHKPELSLQALKHVALHSHAFRSKRDEARQVADRILSLVQTRPTQADLVSGTSEEKSCIQ